MKLIHSLFGLIFFSFVIVSCQREVEGGPNNPSVEPSVLTDFILLDTTYPAGADTVVAWHYDYDNAGRLSRMIIFEKAPSSPANTYLVKLVYDYTYNGTDTLPAKSTTATHEFGQPVSRWDTLWYNYQNGILRSDSLRGRSIPPTTSVETFFAGVTTYTTGGPATITSTRKNGAGTSYLPSYSCVTDYTYNITFTGSNIASQTKTSSGCISNGPVTETFTYDNHPNPFYSVNLPRQVIEDFDPIYPRTQLDGQKNNFISRDSEVFSYVYNAKGYPVIVRTGSSAEKGIYIYKE